MALMEEFVNHMKKVGVEHIDALANWNGWQLLRFFEKSSTCSIQVGKSGVEAQIGAPVFSAAQSVAFRSERGSSPNPDRPGSNQDPSYINSVFSLCDQDFIEVWNKNLLHSRFMLL